MKTVGKQLQEARLAKNWTPELAARETKIKVDRLHDLEGDDYSHFTSPTYARGFVRTYARALGLDEYKILRQLDNKLPDDDSANIVTDTGLAYLPETSLPPRAAHQDFTGLYIVMGLGAVVTLAIVFVLFEAYRVGELSRWFGSNETVATAATSSSTNSTTTPAGASTEAPVARAMPIDGSAPPPAVADVTTNAAPATTDTNAAPAATNAPVAIAPRALPVDAPAVTTDTNSAPSADMAKPAPRALPVDGSTPPSATADATVNAPPRALPVNGTAPPATMPVDPAAVPATNIALNTPPPADIPPQVTPNTSTKLHPTTSAQQAEPPVAQAAPPVALPVDANGTDKPLILTASQDSFVRVTNLDSTETDKPVYAAVLHSGQSIAFSGRKFSINVGIPSAVDIKLDGVNYGPHSDGTAPETFTVQSHLQ